MVTLSAVWIITWNAESTVSRLLDKAFLLRA